MEDIRRELVRRVAADDQGSNPDTYDVIEDETPVLAVNASRSNYTHRGTPPTRVV